MATATNPATVEESAQRAVGEIVGGLALLDANCAVVTIETAEQYQYYGDTMKDVRQRAKLIEAKRIEIVAPLNDALKRINTFFKAPIEILDRIATRINVGMTAYQRQQEEAARQERARLALEASREQERIRKEAEKQAVKAERSGDAQTAAVLRATAETITVPAPIVQAEIPKVAGLATRETWRAEVYDLNALVMAIACGDVPSSAVTPNMTTLNQAARAAKAQLNWPGVRAVVETSVVPTGR